MADMKPTTLHYRVLLHDLQLAITGTQETFAGTLLAQLKKLGYYIEDHVRLDQVKRVNTHHLKDLLDRREDLLWEGLDLSPRSCASERALFCRYLRWFARPPHVPYPRRVLTAPVPQKVLRSFIRFRLGCHGLPIDIGRQQSIPRSERLCTRCNAGIIGDEHHLIFTCSAVAEVRRQYLHLFSLRQRSVQQFMWQRDMADVVWFIHLALEAYDASA